MQAVGTWWWWHLFRWRLSWKIQMQRIYTRRAPWINTPPLHCRIHPQPALAMPKATGYRVRNKPSTSNSARFQQPEDKLLQLKVIKKKKFNDKIRSMATAWQTRSLNASSAREAKKARGPNSKPKAPTYINVYENGKPWWIAFCFSQSYLYQVRHIIDIKPAQRTRPSFFQRVSWVLSRYPEYMLRYI